jgi:hypothetical protein
MNSGHLLADEDFHRVGRVVSRGEHTLFGVIGSPHNRDGAPTTHILKIQSGASNGFGYPARIQQWNDSTGSLSDFDTTEVRVVDPNGGSFASGDYVFNARLLGVNTSGVACFSGTPKAAAASGYLILQRS